MKYLSYFVTDSPAIRDAKKVNDAKAAYVQGRGQAFADRFGGTALFTRGFNPQFVGITFEGDKKPQQPELWTKRTENHRLQRPKEVGVPKKLLERSQALRGEWNTSLPEDEVIDRWESPLLKVLGIAHEDLLEGEGLTVFERSGRIYIATTATLAVPELCEIMASTFLAASELPEDKK